MTAVANDNDGWLKPIDDGWDAGYKGLDPRVCPYGAWTEERDVWMRWHRFGIAFRYDVDGQ